MIRVTSGLTAKTVNRNLSKNYGKLFKLQNTIASGKKINVPSDDPTGMNNILGYRKTLSSVNQYERNMDRAQSWLDFTDSTLQTVEDLVAETKVLALQLGNDTTNVQNRKNAAQKVTHIQDQMQQLLDSKLEGEYVFAGYNTDTRPFVEREVTDITCSKASELNMGDYFTLSSPSANYYVWYERDNAGGDPLLDGMTGIKVNLLTSDTSNEVATATAVAINSIGDFSASLSGNKITVTNTSAGNVVGAVDNNTDFIIDTVTDGNNCTGKINMIISDDAEITINATGQEVFGIDGSGVDIFEVLSDLKTALEDNDTDAILATLDSFDDAYKQVIDVRTDVGAKSNRIESTMNYYSNFKFNISKLRSEREEADMIETLTDLASREVQYQASLAASAKTISKTLLDFL